MLPEINVSLDKLAYNYKLLCENTSTTIGPVVKGNSYGLGRKPLVKKLFDSGCRHFFIADWQEVTDFEDYMLGHAKIYALSGVEPISQVNAVKAGVTPVLHRMDQIISWAKLFGKHEPFVLQIDTGLNRLGMTDVRQIMAMDVNIEFIVNHLVCGYDQSSAENVRQLQEALDYGRVLDKPVSLASSCSFILDPDFIHRSHMIRAGRIVYGIVPEMLKNHRLFSQLQVIATMTAPLINKRSVKVGENVGYDYKYVAPHDMEVGVLNIGYSSGYAFVHREQKVFFDGHYCGILSQSMDFLMIDISDVRAEIGDKFELFGENISQDCSVVQKNAVGGRIILPGQANIVRSYSDNANQIQILHTPRSGQKTLDKLPLI